MTLLEILMELYDGAVEKSWGEVDDLHDLIDWGGPVTREGVEDYLREHLR